MTILGSIFLPSNPPERLPSIARVADEAGLEELWLWEDCFLNGGVSATAAALAVTERLRVGIGIMPVPFRNVAAAAMEIATLRRLYGERALIGLGHGVQEWMAQVGVRAASPMTLLREYLTAMQSLLRGETVTTDGRYVHLDAVRLDWPPSPAPEIYLGATGPKTLQLGGELAQATILSGGTTPEQTARAAELTGHRTIVVFLTTATGPDAAARVARVDQCSVTGDAAEIAAGIQPWIEAGASTVVLQPTPDEPDIEGFLRFIGSQVRPLVP